ncbi:MAG: hypothetical protein ABI632_10575 [Pseudolysinimonas sp.]
MGLYELRWSRPGVPETERAEYLGLLSDAERERYAAAGPTADSFLAGRVLLRRLAAELTGAGPGEVLLEASRCPQCGRAHGAPRLPRSGFRLSLARCETAVVAVATLGRAIGVDVEPCRVDPQRDAAISEVAGVASLRHWTSVEAVLKADGRGLTIDPRLVRAGRRAARFDGTRYRLFEPKLAADLQVSVALGPRAAAAAAP